MVDLLTGDDNYAVSQLWQKFDIVVESEQQRLPVAVPRAVILYKSKVIDEIIAGASREAGRSSRCPKTNWPR